ncbi:alpha/beta hydrolase family protein [Streptococcus oriscaviae]|uniref:Alpha/beta hydrolase n=1 Tax=Streptococcus oriscaviae TaxID=2781599 RepID=A0ABX7YKL3_9STRE|nr:alpha/beta hydrolase [Streptococcus oriscaviae]QUE54230.1 alpha/beta hydrolase [Streptococcus oriscaviae]
MKKNEAILKRQEHRIRFKNKDMDFCFNWLLGISQVIGMSSGELFYIASGIRDGNPADWRNRFNEHVRYLEKEAHEAEQASCSALASHLYFSACYAQRAALQFTDPGQERFMADFHRMEGLFLSAIEHSSISLRQIEIPFEGSYLPGYAILFDDRPRATVIVIGGGDTSGEDLFYFLGYAGWQHGYNVLMVDLPGQGKNPAQGLCFTVDAGQAISAILDWYQAPTDQIALAGFSGGGYFTAQGVEKDKRIKAWIASTAIYDVAAVFRTSFSATLKVPNKLLNWVSQLMMTVNQVAEVNLKKYAWQFGQKDFLTSVSKVLELAQPVDYHQIAIPSLFLVGAGESPELIRQTKVIYEDLRKRGIEASLREFSSASGADAHCQVNHFRLMHHVVFDWLDQVFRH